MSDLKTSAPTSTKAKISRPKAKAKPKVAPKQPKPIPVPKPQSQPVEEALPPLPTKSASERLSESFGGAIDSVVIPQKREFNSSSTLSPMDSPNPLLEQSPLVKNLQLPSAPPQLSRPDRLHPSEPLTIPQKTPRAPMQDPAPVPSSPQQAETLTQTAKVEPTIQPAPAPPSLDSATSFKKPKEEEVSPTKAAPQKTLEESIKQAIPSVPTPTPNIPRIRNSTPSKSNSSAVPEVSVPPLAQTQVPQPDDDTPNTPKEPQREKLSDSLKKLLGKVTVPTLKTSSPVPPPMESSAKKPSEAVPVPSEPDQSTTLDQQIAKLNIPNVSPVESIKKRLQLLDVESSSDTGSSASKQSPGKNQYLAMVEERIDSQWVAPPLLLTNPVVILKFRISRTGEISEIQIDQSSGNSHYDSGARRAVQAANPLPPFPPDVSDSFFDVHFRFIKD